MFIDEAVVELFAGRGGHGMTSFRREKFVEFGGPSGGNGGNGGSIYFVGDEGKLTLQDFRFQRHIKASNGENGKSKGMHGKKADDLYLKVPLGTVFYHLETNEKIGEITEHKEVLLVAKGGRGGRGNIAFATHKNPAPKFSENGDKGQSFKIRIDLKVLADVGLLGFPSVGKSTFISTISNAKPKIADYPFTTLQPNLGVVRHHNTDFVIADLPGLIENASEGVGLGFKFLKHIERCRIFLHMLDLNDEDPISKYNIINSELKKYNEELLQRKQIIVLNKADLVNEDDLKSLKAYFKDQDVFVISAATKQGIKELLDQVILELDNIKPLEKETDTHKVYELQEEDTSINILKEGETFYVTGSQVLLFFERTNFSEEEGILRFARQLRSLGVEDELVKAGIENGDTVNVYGYEFEFMK